jgi:2-amino-4-hydroxy-6-hydroxymethyldihydropteridine diphosphokinase
MSTAYIALGSNVGDRLDFLRKAKEALSRRVNILATSPVYETEPIGTVEKYKFLNAVLGVRTELSPQALLSLCLAVERENGRLRERKNAPRTLDLDLLLYDDLCIDMPDLTLPHPRMHERAFVLAPLADIAPEAPHPVLGISLRQLLAGCEGRENLVRRTDQIL